LSFSNQQVSGRVFKARNIQVFLRGAKATQVQRSVLYKAFKIIAPNASECNLYALDSPKNASDAIYMFFFMQKGMCARLNANSSKQT